MIAKICLIALLGCVLTEANPLKPRYKRETFLEKLGKVREHGAKRMSGVYTKANDSALKVADAGIAMAEQGIDTTGDLVSTVAEGAANFSAGLVDLGTETVKVGGEFGNQVTGGGFRLGTELAGFGKGVVEGTGTFVTGGVKGGFDAGAGIIGMGAQAAKSVGNVGSKIVNNLGEDAANIARAGSGVIRTAEGYILPVLDGGFNVARNTIGSGAKVLTPSKDPVVAPVVAKPASSVVAENPAVSSSSTSNPLALFDKLDSGIFDSDDLSFDLD